MIHAFAFIVAAVSGSSCNSDPAIVHAVAPHVDESQQEPLGRGLGATVQVTVGADGRAANVALHSSSGYAPADEAALNAARQSTYKPEMKDCRPVADTVVVDEAVLPVYTPRAGQKCTTPPLEATVIRFVKAPGSPAPYPAGAVAVRVNVGVNALGDPTSATIVKSSGNKNLDNAAVDAAYGSHYAPKIVNCQPVTGSYLFEVTFAPSKNQHP